MKYLGALLVLFLISGKSWATKTKLINLKADIFAQSYHNTDIAEDNGIDWSSESQIFLALQAARTFNFMGNSLELDFLFRAAQNGAIEEDQERPELMYFIFPGQVVARDVFKSIYFETSDGSYQEAFFYKFAYHWGDQDVKFRAGRFSVNFGQGRIINPVNPLNHAYQISPYYLDQVNDGIHILFNKDPKLKLHLYFFGDKSYTEYSEEITRTVMVRGEWKYSKTTEVNYILGEDQKRHKYGVEASHVFKQGKGYAQVMRYSQNLEEDADSEGLLHYLLGYEQNINKIWSVKGEFGQFQIDENHPENLQYQLLPIENFLGVSNFVKIKDNWSAEADLVIETNSSAMLYKLSSTYGLKKYGDVGGYILGLLKEADDDAEYLYQNTFPTQLGVFFRTVY